MKTLVRKCAPYLFVLALLATMLTPLAFMTVLANDDAPAGNPDSLLLFGFEDAAKEMAIRRLG